MIIAVTKGIGHWKYERYAGWIAAQRPDARIIELSGLPADRADAAVRSADGIVFTGGEDVHPARYGRPDALALCGTIDEARDARELAWCALALERGTPILGVCRGMQLLNVALGGSLVPHLATVASHRDDPRDVDHPVRVAPSSVLGDRLGGVDAVNSFHHQALDRVAPALRVIAEAEDGVIEAVEWDVRQLGSFVLGVQWHPERMPAGSALSVDPCAAFLRAVAR